MALQYDPLWNNVISLIPFDEGNHRTPFDVKQQRAMIASGEAETTTDITLFGKSVGYCDGVNDAFTSPVLSAYTIGTDDFTIEGFVRPVNGGGGATYGRVIQLGGRAVDGSLHWTRTSTLNPLKLLLQLYAAGAYYTVHSDQISIPDGAFTHIALCRQGDVYKSYHNGALISTHTTATGKNLTGNYYTIGRTSLDNTECFRGYFANWRITKGVARYTANFLPPTEPFPQTGTPPAAAPAPTGLDTGRVQGVITVLGVPQARDIMAITHDPLPVIGSDDGTGNAVIAHQVIAAGRSAADGTYSLNLGLFLGEVIVVAMDDYGDRWLPNNLYEPGDLIRPAAGSETGYVYRCTIAGYSYPTEPNWWINTGSNTTGAVGTATFEALESWWPLAHAPIQPERVAYDGIIVDQYFNETVLLTHAEPDANDAMLDPLWDKVALLISGDPTGATGPQDIADQGPLEYALDVNANLTAIVKPYGNGSIYFNGIADHIKTQATAFDWGPGQAKLCFAMSIRPIAKAGTKTIITTRDSAGVTNRILIQLTAANFPQVTWWNGASANAGYATSSIPTPDDVWSDLEINIDGQAVMIMVDGAIGANVTLSNKPSANSSVLWIGATDGDPAVNFKGYLANLEITKDVRHTAAFAAPGTVKPTRRSTLFDSFNNVIYNTMKMAFKRFAKIATGNATYGNGAIELLDSYVDITATPEEGYLHFGSRDLTWEFSYKPQSLAAGNVILDTAFDGRTNAMKIAVAAGGALDITIGGIPQLTTAALAAGTPAHLAISRADNLTRFFLNGAQQGTSINDPSVLDLERIRLGADAQGNNKAPGWYDEIRLTKAGRYAGYFTPLTAKHPDTKYNLSPGDAAVYTWVNSALVNGDFEQPITAGWSTLVIGTLPTSTVMAHEGTYGFGYTSGIYSGRRYQTIAVPANTVMAEVGAWILKNNADADQAGVYIRFYDAGNVEIKGYGGLVTTAGTASHGWLYRKQYCEVPSNATTCRVYLHIQLVGVGTVLNAGGDEVTVRWLVEEDEFRPNMTAVPFINADLWMGNMTGWTPAIITGSSGPVFSANQGDTTGYSVYGSANATTTKLTQTVELPAGDFTHALISYSSSNSSAASNTAGDSDCTSLIVNFKNSGGSLLHAETVEGSAFSNNGAQAVVRANSIVALPTTATQVEADVRFVRRGGTSLNSHFSGISIKLFKAEQPLKTALGIV